MEIQKVEIPRIILLEIFDFLKLPENFIQNYHTHLLCNRGFVYFKFNDRKMRCKSSEFLFWFAESKVTDLQFSKNFKATILLVEKDFLMNNIPDQSWGIDASLYSRENPVKTLDDKKDEQRIIENFKTINDRFQDINHRFYEETLRLQMQIFVLEMWHLFAKEYERRKLSLQSGTLFEKFTHFVQENCMKEREVQFYSDKLNITPKYLNQICKNASGITASEWIQRYAKERIIILLQNKNLNIAEIADEMVFSSRSFFTRYVKKLLGFTPSEYRKKLE